MKKKLLLIVIALSLIPATMAFSISYTNMNNSIFPNQSASYAVSITNDKGFNDSYSFSTQNPSWVLTTNPNLGTVPSFTSRSTVLFLKPKVGMDKGPHAVPVRVESSETNQFQTDNLLVNVKPRTPFGGEYKPAVKLGMEVPQEIDPRNSLAVELSLENQNPRDYPNLTVSVNSELFKREYQMHLQPLASKEKRILFEPDPMEEPGIYTVTTTLTAKNITIAQVSKDYEVVSYSKVEEEMNERSQFFKIFTTYTLTNDANIERKVTKKVKAESFTDWFRSFTPEPEKVRQGGEKYYKWSDTLGPQESITINATENYRVLVLIAVVILVCLGAYYLFRSPIVVEKTAYVMEEGDDNTRMKVAIEIKNRSKKELTNVTVLDKVPNMASYLKKETAGSLTPDKAVKSSSKGTSLRWDLKALEQYEERIITYEIKSKLRVVGGLNLPPAQVKFENESGKERSTFSGEAKVFEG